jgi:hypothetical protein
MTSQLNLHIFRSNFFSADLSPYCPPTPIMPLNKKLRVSPSCIKQRAELPPPPYAGYAGNYKKRSKNHITNSTVLSKHLHVCHGDDFGNSDWLGFQPRNMSKKFMKKSTNFVPPSQGGSKPLSTSFYKGKGKVKIEPQCDCGSPVFGPLTLGETLFDLSKKCEKIEKQMFSVNHKVAPDDETVDIIGYSIEALRAIFTDANGDFSETVDTFSKKMDKTTKRATENFDETTKRATSDIGETIDSFTKKMEKNVDKIINGVKTTTIKHKHDHSHGLDFHGAIDFIKDNWKIFLLICLCGLALYSQYTNKNYKNQLTFLATIVSVLYVGHESVTWFIGEILEVVKQTFTNQVVMQGGVSTPLLSNLAMGGVFASIFRGIKATTALEIVEEFAKKSIYLKRMHEGISFTVDYFLHLMQEFVTFVTNIFGGEPIVLKSDPFWEVKVFSTKVSFLLQIYAEEPMQDTSYVCSLVEHITEGEVLRKKLLPLPNSAADMQTLGGLLQALGRTKAELASRMVNISGQRPEPIMVLLTGAPGIGKTQCSLTLWPTLTARTLPTNKLDHFCERSGDYCFAYNQADDYYSGYRGEWNMIVDELGFLRDIPGGPSVWSELIQWVNVNPMNLNMASLHEKGRAYFRSRFIWATTNRRHFNGLNSIEEPEAVYRRLRLTFITGVRKEFRTSETVDARTIWDHKVDFDKVKLANIGPSDFDHLYFVRVNDLRTGTYDNRQYNYDELVDLIEESYIKSIASDTTLLSGIQDKVADIVKNRRKVVVTPQAHVTCGKCPACNRALIMNKKVRLRELLISLGFESNDEDCYVLGFDSVKHEELEYLFDRAGRKARKDKYVGCLRDPSISAEEFVNSLVWNLVHNTGSMFVLKDLQKNPYINTFCAGLVFSARFLAWIAVFKLIGTGIRYFFPPADKEEQGDYGHKRIMLKHVSHKVVPQFGEDPNAATLAKKILTKNVWRFFVDSPLNPTQKAQGCVLVLQNNIVLMPEHYIGMWASFLNGTDGKVLDVDATVTFKGTRVINKSDGTSKPRSLKLKISEILDYFNEDGTVTGHVVAVGDVGDDTGIFRINGITGPCITHLFRSKKDKRPPPRHKGVLCTVNTDLVEIYYGADYQLTGPMNYTSDGKKIAQECVMYDVATRTGDCGSPFLLYDKSSESKIMSIHTGGMGAVRGIGAVVYREDIEVGVRYLCQMFDMLVDIGTKALHEDVEVLVQSSVYTDLSGFPVTVKAKSIPQIKKSRLIPSPIHDVVRDFPSQKKPAMLGPRGGIDPMDFARWGYGTECISPDPKLLKACTEDYIHEFFACGRKVNAEYARVLSFEEAVQGLEGVEFFDGINRKTSPGWPMKHLLPSGSKRSAFGKEDWEFGNEHCEKVREHVNHMKKTILKGERPFVVNHHFLKDELRSFEKAEGGKTRLISSSDLVYSILLRQHTLSFSAYAMENRILNGSAVGTDAHGDDWKLIYMRHGGGQKGFRCIAGDFSAYDKSLSPAIISTIKVIMTKFYDDQGDDSWKIRNGLLDEVVQSRHLCGDLVYDWMGSNPSGNPLTALLNTMTNVILTRYAILMASPTPIMEYVDAVMTLKAAREVIKMTAYGDDGLTSIKLGRGFDHITQESMTEAYSLVGMTYTDELKTGVMVEDRTIDDCNFLKRGFARNFYRDKSRIMAPLALSTILETIQWTNDHDIDLSFWQDKLTNQVQELAAHERVVFDKWIVPISEAVKNSNTNREIMPCVSTYEDAQDFWIRTKIVY